MKPRNIQSELTQNDIFTALMILLEQKEFSKITITELCKKAGVSRMAFYRNYNCKEDIISNRFDEFFTNHLEQITTNQQVFTIESMTLYFSFFREHKIMVDYLIKSNLSLLLLKSSTTFLTGLTLAFICDEPDDYVISFMAGGLYQVLIKWIEGGMRESNQEFATKVYYLLMD